jgi:hypothetical protein
VTAEGNTAATAAAAAAGGAAAAGAGGSQPGGGGGGLISWLTGNGQGLTLVPISAQLELFCPPYSTA